MRETVNKSLTQNTSISSVKGKQSYKRLETICIFQFLYSTYELITQRYQQIVGVYKDISHTVENPNMIRSSICLIYYIVNILRSEKVIITYISYKCQQKLYPYYYSIRYTITCVPVVSVYGKLMKVETNVFLTVINWGYV